MNNVYQIGSGELTFDIIERIINEIGRAHV